VICKERSIIKREHRTGLHISAYVMAHMIYQAVICMIQVVITITIFWIFGVYFPDTGLITGFFTVDLGISMFLMTYAADTLALLASCISHTTTTAMTIMPFLLIFQLVFSGGFFSIPKSAEPITNLTVAKWGLTALCAQGDYNSLPMVSVWNSLYKMRGLEYQGMKPVEEITDYILENNQRDEFLMKTAEYNRDPTYDFDPAIVMKCWGWLLLWTFVYVLIATILLEFIDRDRR
jgi:hypothetical protein